MCLAVPAKVLEIKDAVGQVEISGVTRDVSMMLLPEAKPGEARRLRACACGLCHADRDGARCR